MVTPEEALKFSQTLLQYCETDAGKKASTMIADLASQVESLQADAARWKYARDYLSIEDVESWAIEMKGHVPDEVESLKTDAAIDEARKQS